MGGIAGHEGRIAAHDPFGVSPGREGGSVDVDDDDDEGDEEEEAESSQMIKNARDR